MAATCGLDEERFKRASMALWIDFAIIKAHGEAGVGEIKVETVTF